MGDYDVQQNLLQLLIDSNAPMDIRVDSNPTMDILADSILPWICTHIRMLPRLRYATQRFTGPGNHFKY